MNGSFAELSEVLWLPGALMLISAVMHAVTNGCLKASADKLNTRAVTSLTYCLCGLPFVFWFGPPEAALYPYFALSMTVHFAYQLLQIATLRFGDLSAVYPISRGVAPILVAGGAILFLGEQVVLLKWIGLLIICLSIALFALEGGSGGGTPRRAIGLALAHGVTIAGYTLIDAAAIRLAEHPMVFVAWFFVLDGLMLPIIQTVRQGHWLGKTAHRDIRFGVTGGLLSVVGFSMALYAFRTGKLAELAVLRETSVVFAAIIGAVFLGESFGVRRTLAAAIIVSGILLMQLA